VDNPGLKRHTESFLKVSNRRYANPIMPAPQIDATEQGYLYNSQMNPLDPNALDNTQREDVETPPSMAGGATSLPVPATNGELTQDRSVNLRQHMAGQPATQVPGEVRQKRTDPVEMAQHAQQDMQEQLAQGARDRQIAVQKADGRDQNPAYNQAQQEIQDKLNLRRAHPLHQGALIDTPRDPWESGEDPADLGLRHFFDTDYVPPRDEDGFNTSVQPMIQFKKTVPPASRPGDAGLDDPAMSIAGEPSCETCWLKGNNLHASESQHQSRFGHPFKPLGMEPNQRFSAVDEYEVHPDEIGYLGARDFYHIPLRERPWELGTPETRDAFDARVREIMDSAQHEGIREPLDVFGPVMHDGAHRWEAARRLNIPVRIQRRGHHDPTQDMHALLDVQGTHGN